MVDGPLSTAGANAYTELGGKAKRMARELAARESERDAWARLVKSTSTLFLLAMGVGIEAAVDPKSAGRDLAPERAAVAAAKQALRDLGVDVDTLLR